MWHEKDASFLTVSGEKKKKAEQWLSEYLPEKMISLQTWLTDDRENDSDYIT